MVLDIDTLKHDALQKVCHSHGGYLPEPRSHMENTFLNNLGQGTFTLGLTDTATEGQWVWDSDGSKVNWKNWMDWSTYVDEPNGFDGQNCVVMSQQMWNHVAGHKTDGWVDVSCDSDYYIGSKPTNLICERYQGLCK